ncbi:MAG TPA: hypothetical protein VGM75_12850 [Pseudonocardiaceae bacterium]
MLGGGDSGGPLGWTAPPRMIGGHATGALVIARSDGLVVALRQILAYPTGFEIEIEAHARGASPGGPPPDPSEVHTHGQPDFRLRLADGTDVREGDKIGFRGGHGPMLVLSSAGSSWGSDPTGREDFRLTLWAWPLPPPGPLTLISTWPRRGLDETYLALDGEAIRAAALRAEPFWTMES